MWWGSVAVQCPLLIETFTRTMAFSTVRLQLISTCERLSTQISTSPNFKSWTVLLQMITITPLERIHWGAKLLVEMRVRCKEIALIRSSKRARRHWGNHSPGPAPPLSVVKIRGRAGPRNRPIVKPQRRSRGRGCSTWQFSASKSTQWPCQTPWRRIIRISRHWWTSKTQSRRLAMVSNPAQPKTITIRINNMIRRLIRSETMARSSKFTMRRSSWKRWVNAQLVASGVPSTASSLVSRHREALESTSRSGSRCSWITMNRRTWRRSL